MDVVLHEGRRHAKTSKRDRDFRLHGISGLRLVRPNVERPGVGALRGHRSVPR